MPPRSIRSPSREKPSPISASPIVVGRAAETAALTAALTDADTGRGRTVLVVGESGIFTPADLARLGKAGVSAFLIGESLMRQKDVSAATKALLARNIRMSAAE